jgi:hypothetical protein
MQFQETSGPPPPAVPASGTERLRFRLEELAASGFIPAKTRQALQELLLRIDLSTATPLAVDARRELWILVRKYLQNLRHENIMLPPHVDRELYHMISNYCETQITQHQSLMVTPCLICADDHKLQKKNLAFKKPDAWFYLSPTDIAERCEGNENFLSIDMRRFFIRGLLPLMYQEETVKVEMWVEVDKHEFGRFIDRFLSGLKVQSGAQQSLKLKGTLANRLLHGLNDGEYTVDIFCDGDAQPTFWLTDNGKDIYRGQKEGLSVEVFSQMFSGFAHSQSILETKARVGGEGIPLNIKPDDSTAH